MPNIDGKEYGFTAITPMKRWKTPFLRVFFWLVPILAKPLPQRLLGWIPIVRAQHDLTALSFIHFARWSIIRHDFWPQLDAAQPRDETRYDYLIFCSNFNGTWEQYIDAFSAIIPGGMQMIWRWSEQFPGSQPITPFLAYIRRVQVDTAHYHSAYPDASANDVKQALKLQARLDAFATTSASLTAEQFAVAYRAMLVEVQDCLGTTGLDPWIVDWQEAVIPDGVRPETLGPRGLHTPVQFDRIPVQG